MKRYGEYLEKETRKKEFFLKNNRQEAG